MTRRLASNNDGFPLDFAWSLVYLTAIVGGITPMALFLAFWEAMMPLYALMVQACTQDDLLQWMRTTATRGEMSAAEALSSRP
jgi:hypothetical protein